MSERLPSQSPRTEHPRIKTADETRTVLTVDFNSIASRQSACETADETRTAICININRTVPKQRFCEKYESDTVIRAVREKSEAAEEFIRTFDQFEHFGPRRMELAILHSIKKSEKAALYFLLNLSDYFEYLNDEGLKKSLLKALGHKQASQYFLANFHLFRDLSCFEIVFRVAKGDYRASTKPELLLVSQED